MEPKLLTRVDGSGLLYSGRLNWLLGEWESGKSWLVAVAAADLLRKGEPVVWLDYESDEQTIIERLRALSVEDDEIVANLRYVRPDVTITDVPDDHLTQLLEGAALVVVDACSESMAYEGFDPYSNPEVVKWVETYIARLRYWGAAVVVIDHVKKQDGHYNPNAKASAIGAQHKMSAVDGCALEMKMVRPFGRGLHGVAKVLVAKDRPGYVRRIAAQGKWVADFHHVANDDGSVVKAELLPATGAADPGKSGFRPTFIMKKVTDYLATQDGPVSFRHLQLHGRCGKTTYLRTALEVLVKEGYVKEESGPHNARLFSLVRPYQDTGDEVNRIYGVAA
jgi:hypothetical protein